METKSKAARHPKAGFLNRDLRKQGIEIQTYGLASDQLVYAGVHFVRELNARTIFKLHRHWARWRKWYDTLPENRRRDYPAKHSPQVIELCAHPIALPEQQIRLRLS